MSKFASERPQRRCDKIVSPRFATSCQTAWLLALCAAGLVGGAAPRTAHADVVSGTLPDATYTEEAFGVPPDIKLDQSAPGVATASDASEPGALIPFSSHAFASTTISSTLSGLGAFISGDGANEATTSNANAGFSMEAVEITQPTGHFDFIPVDVHGTLTASAAAHGMGPSGQTINVRSLAVFHLIQTESVQVSCVSSEAVCDVQQQDGSSFSDSKQPDLTNVTSSLSYSFQAGLPPNQVVTAFADVESEMSISGILDEEGTAINAQYSALSDPAIEIDPSFAFKDDFELVFSPNLFSPTSAVPEPSSTLLFAAGLGLLATLRQMRCRGSRPTRRTHEQVPVHMSAPPLRPA